MSDETISEPHWLSIYKSSIPNRLLFKRILLVYALADYLFTIWSISTGSVVGAFIGELLASQLPILVASLTIERGEETIWQRLTLLNPRTQSWAFLADWALAGSLACSAAQFSRLPSGYWFNESPWNVIWAIASLGLGIILAASFRKGEGDAYDVLRYNSYSKLLHNGLAFTVLSALICFSLIPIFVAGSWDRGLTWLTVGLFAIWALAAVLDGWRAGTLTPDHPLYLSGENLHPQAGKDGRPVHEIGVPTWSKFRGTSPDLAYGWGDILHVRKLFRSAARTRNRQ